MKKGHMPIMKNTKSAPSTTTRNIFGTRSFRFGYCLVLPNLNNFFQDSLVHDCLDLSE